MARKRKSRQKRLPIRQSELVIIGFPKCGTTALLHAVGDLSGSRILSRKDGAQEVPITELEKIRPSGNLEARYGYINTLLIFIVALISGNYRK